LHKMPYPSSPSESRLFESFVAVQLSPSCAGMKEN
jgi:hypothetical protein